jgi:hypothetical protein
VRYDERDPELASDYFTAEEAAAVAQAAAADRTQEPNLIWIAKVSSRNRPARLPVEISSPP